MRLWAPLILIAALAVTVVPRVVSDGFGTVDPCDPTALGQYYGPISTIYAVEDGELAGVCFGADDPAVYRAWSALTLFTTAEERSPLRGFAGFANTSGADVVAYAATLNSNQTDFLIGVDLKMVDLDMPVVRRVMVHEFAHVLTGTAQGADRSEPDCATRSNKFGCVTTNNYLSLWVDSFWSEAELETLERNGDRSSAEAARRCGSDPSFPSRYGATNPAEDFADSMVYFAFSNQVAAPVQPRIRFLSTFPELVQMRNRIAAAGLADTRRYVHNCS